MAQIDGYGNPLRRDARGKLRKRAIRAGKMLRSRCLYVCMCVVGALLWLGRGGKKFAPLSPRTAQPRHILVIRLDLIGDLVLSMTVVRALKRTYPDAEIDLLALPSSAQVVKYDPDLSNIIGYDPNVWRRPKALVQGRNWRDSFRLMRQLRARRYDVAAWLVCHCGAHPACRGRARR